MQNESTLTLIAIPGINSIQFSNSTVDLLYTIFCPSVSEQPANPLTLLPTPAILPSTMFSMLLNPSHKIGPNMAIGDFVHLLHTNHFRCSISNITILAIFETPEQMCSLIAKTKNP